MAFHSSIIKVLKGILDEDGKKWKTALADAQRAWEHVTFDADGRGDGNRNPKVSDMERYAEEIYIERGGMVSLEYYPGKPIDRQKRERDMVLLMEHNFDDIVSLIGVMTYLCS
jgi:hypothetical protein